MKMSKISAVRFYNSDFSIRTKVLSYFDGTPSYFRRNFVEDGGSSFLVRLVTRSIKDLESFNAVCKQS